MFANVILLVALLAVVVTATERVRLVAPDITKGIKNNELAGHHDMSARHSAVRQKMSSRLTQDNEWSAESMNHYNLEGMLEVSIYDVFSWQPDDGVSDCHNHYGETRYTFELGHCMPDPGFVDGGVAIKVAASQDGARFASFMDADCTQLNGRASIMTTDCVNGVKTTVVQKRSPHAMGLSEK
jgi:hypothetical protein